MWIIGVGVALRVVRESESGDRLFPSQSLVTSRLKVAIYALLAAPAKCAIRSIKISDIRYFGHTALGVELAISTQHGSPGTCLHERHFTLHNAETIGPRHFENRSTTTSSSSSFVS